LVAGGYLPNDKRQYCLYNLLMKYLKIFFTIATIFIVVVFIKNYVAHAEEACCVPKGPNAAARYQEAINSAVNEYVKDPNNSEVVNALGNSSKMGIFLTGVADILKAGGYDAGRVSNCRENPDRPSNDAMIVGKSSVDPIYGDRYDMLKSYETNQIKNSQPSFTALERMTHCLGCTENYGDPPPKSDEVACGTGGPLPTPGVVNYACRKDVVSEKSSCEVDATGPYTSSSCDGKCEPPPPDTRYSCNASKQCVKNPNGIFSNCVAACGTPPKEAEAPIITNIKPTEAVVEQEIEVFGTNLGNVVSLISLADQSSVSFNGAIADASRTLTKFQVPSETASGTYQVLVFGWGKYASKSAISPQNLTVKIGGAPFTGSTVLGVPTEGLQTFGELFTFIFAWSLRLLGIAVFVRIFYAGILWFTAAGNTAKVTDAKGKMTNAILGAILLLSAYLILYTINPDLVGGTWTLPGVGTTP